MINSYGITLIAGQPGRIVSAGAFFSLKSGNVVDVSFIRQGAVIGRASNQDTGFYARAKQGEEFDEVMLVSETSQNVEILIGENEAGAASSVSLSGVAFTAPAPLHLSQQVSLTLGTAAIQALPENPARRLLIVQNTHASAVAFIGFDSLATGFPSIRIMPDSSLILDNPCPLEELTARASVGSASSIVVAEWVS